MFQQLRTLSAAIAGGIAAIITWLLIDASGLASEAFSDRGETRIVEHGVEYLVYQGVFAILLSLTLAIADGIYRDVRSQRVSGLLAGLGCGLCGAILGPGIGLGFCLMFRAPEYSPDGSSSLFLLNIFFMSVGWSLTGATAGAAQGAARRSAVIAERGAVGGFLGALVGGTMFQLATAIFDQDPSTGLGLRLGALVITGTLAGALSRLVPDMTRNTWLRAVTSRGYGREYSVSRSPFRIGSHPESDIVIPKDKNVAPTHVILESIPQTRRHRLRHAARAVGGKDRYPATVLNEEPITSEKWLCDGDIIQIGGAVYEFNDRSTRLAKFPEPNTRRPYIEDRAWEMTAGKTTAIRKSILPAADPGEAQESGSTTHEPVLETTLHQIEDKKPAPAVASPAEPPGRKVIGTRLACIDGPYLGQSFPLSHESSLIGRSLDHSIALPADTSVSRTHARIIYESGRHVISDFGSSNGVLLNDEFVTSPQALHIADVIIIGSTHLRYE